MEEKNNILISQKLFELIQNRVNESHNEFESVNDYVEYVLSELLGGEESSPYTKEEEEKVEKHLKDMGYI